MVSKAQQKDRPEETAEPSFEQILSGLENVVVQLEEGELPLERSLAVFEEGIRLSRMGARRLDEAEHRVELLLADSEGVRTRALNEEQVEET